MRHCISVKEEKGKETSKEMIHIATHLAIWLRQEMSQIDSHLAIWVRQEMTQIYSHLKR